MIKYYGEGGEKGKRKKERCTEGGRSVWQRRVVGNKRMQAYMRGALTRRKSTPSPDNASKKFSVESEYWMKLLPPLMQPICCPAAPFQQKAEANSSSSDGGSRGCRRRRCAERLHRAGGELAVDIILCFCFNESKFKESFFLFLCLAMM